MTENEIIIKIKEHELGNKNEAFSLYFSLCELLNKKYGFVDRDYDEKPTKRGKEWIQIHHIKEYKLDDIAKRTEAALSSGNYELLNKLKSYNIKTQLVYANMIEHFLLHYLIDSIRGQNVFSGGPNYLWDYSVALDIYGFEQEFMNKLQVEREKLYSLITSEEITVLYKKLIDWKYWDIKKCSNYWVNYKLVLNRLYSDEVSFIFDNYKFFKLFDILGYRFKKKDINIIKNVPYKVTTFTAKNGVTYKQINGHFFLEDGKTIVCFNGIFERKSFTIPYYVERLAVGAFDRTYHLETITIPTTVKSIEDRAFIEQKIKTNCCAEINKIIYKGTREEWNERFANVILNDINLVCKK